MIAILLIKELLTAVYRSLRAFGKASLAPPKDSTPDTLFPVGSASKSLREASVALLSLLPDDFVMPGENHSDVTVEDVLSRWTGMTPAAQPDDARSITRNLPNLSVAAPNRTEFIYSKMAYTVTTHLVESVSKLSFSDFLENHLVQPLNNDAGEYREIPCYDAAGIISSASDYIKWVNAIIKRQGPITEGVFEGFIEGRILQDLSGEDTGWDIRWYCGRKMVSHNESGEGLVCNRFFIPDLNLEGVIMSNSDMAREVLKSQSMPLSVNTGEYQNPGYRKIKVEEREGLLLVDASNQSMQTKYIAHVRENLYGGDPPIVGLHLEEGFQKYIWFNQVNEEGVHGV
ncbi:beta-lactamase/transpeptidase-like protein [Ilyonectria sp. MPI-CAGE-AT-0026]|nr:beta-lactamase/transpeptidase-like protein [Ilyonectria sp. MPI-CAGE-AT-0026]